MAGYDPLKNGLFDKVPAVVFQSPRPQFMAKPTPVLPSASLVRNQFEAFFAQSPMPKALSRANLPSSSHPLTGPLGPRPVLSPSKTSSASVPIPVAPLPTSVAATVAVSPAPVTAVSTSAVPSAASDDEIPESQDSQTQGKRAENEPVDKPVAGARVLLNWFISLVPGGIKVHGVYNGENWGTTPIQERTSARNVCTSKSTYFLSGAMDTKEALERGGALLSEAFVRKFEFGFPENWKDLVAEALVPKPPVPAKKLAAKEKRGSKSAAADSEGKQTKQDIVVEPPKTTVGGKRTAVEALQSDAKEASERSRTERSATRRKTVSDAGDAESSVIADAKVTGKRKADSDEQPAPKKAKEVVEKKPESKRQHAKDAKTAVKNKLKQSKKSEKRAAATPRAADPVTPRRERSAPVTPVTPTALADVGDRLPHSRSGRVVIPTLKFWEGERVYRGKHGESGVVAVAVQGAASGLVKRAGPLTPLTAQRSTKTPQKHGDGAPVEKMQ